MRPIDKEHHELREKNRVLKEENRHLRKTLKAYKRAINTERKCLPDCYCSQKTRMDGGCAFCEVWQAQFN